MKKLAPVLLLIAIVLPVAVFWLFLAHSQLHPLISAAISIAIGWALNIAWAMASADASQPNNLSIARRFGWACPAVLALLAWLAWHFFANRAA